MKDLDIKRKENRNSLQCFLEENKEIKKIEKRGNNFSWLSFNGKYFPNDFSYYSGIPSFYVSYISDIHLEHHLNKSGTINSIIEKSVRDLWNSIWNIKEELMIFSGDISSSPELTVLFFKRFLQYFTEKQKFIQYKKAKDFLLNLKTEKETFKRKKESYIERIERFEKYIQSLKTDLLPKIRFRYIEKEKDKEKNYSDSSWKRFMEYYKYTKKYKNRNLSKDYERKLDYLIQKLDQLENIKKEYSDFLLRNDNTEEKCLFLREFFGKDIKDIFLEMVSSKEFINEYYGRGLYDLNDLLESKKIIFVLGNHEYINFNSIDEAVKYYKNKLEPLGINVLQNEIIEGTMGTYYQHRYVIYGGSGFAKYNYEYNADTIYCAKGFSREDEIFETEKFEEGYNKAKKYAKKINACFICISHYPIKDCMRTTEPDTIYFYGHNHKNYFRRDEKAIIYADNQIGYKNKEIKFNSINFGTTPNPYGLLEDGFYKTTFEDYFLFYEGFIENIGEGKLLKKRLKTGDLYVIKDNGYYGFFIIDEKKGISIVDGGRTKNITKTCDIEWLKYNFPKVLQKSLKGMLPYRLAQEKISEELMDLGFCGDIHGSIIDITKYYHIMLNPFNAKVYFYSYFNYNDAYSLPEVYESFKDALISMGQDQPYLFKSEENFKNIIEKIEKNSERKDYILGISKDDNFLDKSKKDQLLRLSGNQNNQDLDFQEASIIEINDIYNVSRRISPLQRLFIDRVLRFFDLGMCETMPTKQIESSDEKGSI